MASIKKIIAVVAAAATVSALGVEAFAIAGHRQIPQNEFHFELAGRGQYKWSNMAEKEDNEDYAVVYTTGGYVSSENPVYMSIHKSTSLSSSDRLSGSITVTSPSDRYEIDYTTIRGAGSHNYLYVSSGYNAAEIEGYWLP